MPPCSAPARRPPRPSRPRLQWAPRSRPPQRLPLPPRHQPRQHPPLVLLRRSLPPLRPRAGTPVRGGSAIISLDIDPIHLDVQKQVTLWSTQATEHIYDSLTVFDENMEVKPSLAESWETPDPTTYIFHLRKGVKWHNGREFVASDVAYWHERIMDPKIGATQRGSWMVVKQLDIVDDYTVKLSLSKPSASLLALFATMRESAIPNKETVEKNGDLANVAVGTGPFKLAEFVPGDHVRYVRNPDYWVKDLPYLDEFTLKVMPGGGPAYRGATVWADPPGLAQPGRGATSGERVAAHSHAQPQGAGHDDSDQLPSEAVRRRPCAEGALAGH